MLQYLLSSFSYTQMNNTTLGGTSCSHQNLSDRQEGKDAGRWAVSWLSLFHDQDLSIDVRFVVQGYGL